MHILINKLHAQKTADFLTANNAVKYVYTLGLESIKLITLAESLGGVESLVFHSAA